jgi:4-hydroxy-tetrahydrodipicolinate reductase
MSASGLIPSETAPLRVAIAGASGRMGRMLIETVLQAKDTRLVGALDIAGNTSIGRDAGDTLGVETGVLITDSLDVALAQADCLIDFTRPSGTLTHLQGCVKHGVNIIIGTTGFEAAGKEAIRLAGERVGVVFAPNMSVGVNATFKLLEVAARILSHGYDIEVIEAHHRHKVDAPSGTALRMGEVVADALGRKLDEVAVYGREGVTGERDPSTIGFATIRGGDIVGDHTVLFAGIGERIEITHKSSSRMTYATGSLRAARFLATRKSGVFDMQDVLGLK